MCIANRLTRAGYVLVTVKRTKLHNVDCHSQTAHVPPKVDSDSLEKALYPVSRAQTGTYSRPTAMYPPLQACQTSARHHARDINTDPAVKSALSDYLRLTLRVATGFLCGSRRELYSRLP